MSWESLKDCCDLQNTSAINKDWYFLTQRRFLNQTGMCANYLFMTVHVNTSHLLK